MSRSVGHRDSDQQRRTPTIVQPALFGSNNVDSRTERYAIDGDDIVYYPNLLRADDCDRWLSALRESLPWRQETMAMYGNAIAVPRLSSWHGDQPNAYTYSQIEMQPLPMTRELVEVKETVEILVAEQLNSVLANLYRDGSDSVAWHADDERELGPEPVVVSVSLGATRKFQLRSRTTPYVRHDIDLAHASVLVMRGQSQWNWMHQVPKTKARVGERINLTYRYIWASTSAATTS